MEGLLVTVDVNVHVQHATAHAAAYPKTTLRAWSNEPVSALDLMLARTVAHARPAPLRAYDQISMRTVDFARQGRLAARLMVGRRVAFVGDMVGMASMLGLIAASGGAAPAGMLLLDFDPR